MSVAVLLHFRKKMD